MENLIAFQQFIPKNESTVRSGRNGAVIYTRVSTKEQAETNASLETQKKYCELFADRKGMKVMQYFGGTYESAKTDERKEFSKMLAYVKRHPEITNIIVYSYDRFSRTGTNGAYISEQLKKQGVLVCSVTQEVDASTSAGSFQQDLFFMFSKFDNEIRKDKSVAGMRERLRKGIITGAIPFGYTNTNPGRGKEAVLVINSDGELLRKAFMWKAQQNMSYSQITKRLNKLGWTRPAKKLSEYFKNPVYCGLIVSSLLPGEIIEGKHPPLVSREIFLKVNDILAQIPKGDSYNMDEENLPLKRFLKAESTGTPYTGYLVKSKGLYYYKNNVNGSNENIAAKKLHRQFSELLENYRITDPTTIGIYKTLLMEGLSDLYE